MSTISQGRLLSHTPRERGYTAMDIVGRFFLSELEQLSLNDWSRGEQWILFPENLNVSRDEVEGNKIHCSPRDQSLSDLL